MVAAVVALLLVAVVVTPAEAAMPGDLDPAFGGDGRIALAAAGAFVPRAVGVDGQDRIVVAGYLCAPDSTTRDGTCLSDGDTSFRLARLTSDGGLDAEFGDNGFVTTPIGEGRSQALDLVVFRDGRVLAAGVARVGGRDVFALASFTAGGALDPSFGQGGIALAGVGASFASLGDVELGRGGTILAAGQAVDSSGVARMAVARFTRTGDLDQSFGTGGVTLGGTRAFGYGLGVAAEPDGGALVAGLFGDSAEAETFRFGELRVDSNGTFDPDFGSGGIDEQTVGSSSSFANAVARANIGWVAAGAATVGDGRQAMAVVRGDAKGALTDGYGRDGRAVIALGDGAVANDVVVDAADRALLIGQAANGGEYDFATVRLTAAGRRDSSYGTDGAAIVRWPDFPIARATAGVLQSTGALVTVGLGCEGGTGSRCIDGQSRLLVARQVAGSDRTAPAIKVSALARRVSVRRLNGLRVHVGLSEPGRLACELWAHGRKLWSARRAGPADDFTVRLHARPAALRRLRGRRISLTLRAADLAGNAATRRFTLKLRRR